MFDGHPSKHDKNPESLKLSPRSAIMSEDSEYKLIVVGQDGNTQKFLLRASWSSRHVTSHLVLKLFKTEPFLLKINTEQE